MEVVITKNRIRDKKISNQFMQTNENDYGEIWKDDNKKLLFYLSKTKKKQRKKINTDKRVHSDNII